MGFRKSVLAAVLVAGWATPSLCGTAADGAAGMPAVVPCSDGVAQPATKTIANRLLRSPVIVECMMPSRILR